MKILNLYAGIGGNAKSFEGHEVTAVEYDPMIAEIYKQNFPDHTVIVGDAVTYLLENYMNFDMIWASPPCPSHSRARKHLAFKKDSEGNVYRQNKPIIPDMTLYGIIVFLETEIDFNGLYVVENVIPYYEPLIKGNKIGRHLFWSNVDLSNVKYKGSGSHDSSISEMEEHKGFDLSNTKGLNKRTLLRNAVDYRISDEIMKEIDLTYCNDM